MPALRHDDLLKQSTCLSTIMRATAPVRGDSVAHGKVRPRLHRMQMVVGARRYFVIKL